MIPVRCPTCGRAFEIASLDELPSFPFCSDRCKLIDLGRWLDGDYGVKVVDPEIDDDAAAPDGVEPESNGHQAEC